MSHKPDALDTITVRTPARIHLGANPNHAALDKVRLDAEGMTTPALKKRCANSAAKAGKFLTSAYAIIEADLPYFIELRQRLNAQGKAGEGWQQWIKKHFTCDVRTVNRALSSLRGPENERKKTVVQQSAVKLRPALKAFTHAFEPAIELARKHNDDPASVELLMALSAGELQDYVPQDKMPRSEIIQPRPGKYYLVTFGADYSQRVVAKNIGSSIDGSRMDFTYRYALTLNINDLKRVIREATKAEMKEELAWELRKEMMDAGVWDGDLSDPSVRQKLVDHLKGLETSSKLSPHDQGQYRSYRELLESLYPEYAVPEATTTMPTSRTE